MPQPRDPRSPQASRPDSERIGFDDIQPFNTDPDYDPREGLWDPDNPHHNDRLEPADADRGATNGRTEGAGGTGVGEGAEGAAGQAAGAGAARGARPAGRPAGQAPGAGAGAGGAARPVKRKRALPKSHVSTTLRLLIVLVALAAIIGMLL